MPEYEVQCSCSYNCQGFVDRSAARMDADRHMRQANEVRNFRQEKNKAEHSVRVIEVPCSSAEEFESYAQM